ncbi:MAG: EAL domain-containing protein [Alphaproteobacteria bacterium]|nr:EAL domain-containing protein [Alphaproteobacteria bacterium]
MFAKSLTLAKSDLDRAFAENEFAIVLQPQIEVDGGAVVAAEAFVRWNHPSFGAMTPQLFLPFVEAHGESPRLLDAVVRRALEAALAFRNAGRDWRVSVNLGASDLQSGTAPEIVLSALNDLGADPTCLVLEAPEAALVAQDSVVRAALERLRLFGCGVALDSGGSLPLEAAETAPELFTEIKIGGPSIMRFAEIARKVDGGRIARRLAFANKHDLQSVAVGVEQEKTLAALVKLGFGAIQGAFVAKPTSLEALLGWDGTWSGETQVIAPAPLPARPKPRLVPPAAAPVFVAPAAVEPPPAPAPKLVEQLAPEPADFTYEDDADAFDVSFDDDAFDESAMPVEAAMMEEADPSEDPEVDGEELGALDASAPLTAGLIERPRKKAAAMAMVMEEQVFEAEPEIAAPGAAQAADPMEAVDAFARRIALRVKPEPIKPTLMERLGLRRFARR